MKVILVSAYAINPYKGSEDGMGWNFVLQIARFQKVIAITRENNRPHIERYQSEYPNELYAQIQFLYYDLPYWMRFWKKGSRGAMLYYLMWQKGIVSFIKKQKIHFDIAHNLNFHNDWTPSFLYQLEKPMVWGPIGHHPAIPKQYLSKYSVKYYVKDRLTWMVKNYFWKISPMLTKTARKSDFVLAMNQSVEKKLTAIKGKSAVIPSVATQDFGCMEAQINRGNFTLISAGRFVPLKGFDLSIIAFSKFLKSIDDKALSETKIELVLVGSGPEESYLKSLVKELTIEPYVKFINWIERAKLMEIYKTSSVFLFPSHEGAGMVVAEALSFGLPVICLDNEGPGEFVDAQCAFAVKESDYETTVDSLAQGIKVLFEDQELRVKMSKAARQHFLNHFDWDRRGIQLQEIYQSL
jgi:glycosyltransferase involved in cell wall biosynthesis